MRHASTLGDRLILECGGLTPLSFFLSFFLSFEFATIPKKEKKEREKKEKKEKKEREKKEKKESGVKPPHSKNGLSKTNPQPKTSIILFSAHLLPIT
jgi:hypothetical protein